MIIFAALIKLAVSSDEQTTTYQTLTTTLSENYYSEDKMVMMNDFFGVEDVNEDLIDIEDIDLNPFTRGGRKKNRLKANQERPNPAGIAVRSELNLTDFWDDDLELITGRKKFLLYGEYAGGFEKFNREVELDKSDEVDRDVKDKISDEKWNVRTGNGFGPGFGNIGKGGENMRSDVVQFQKYKMTKDCFLIGISSLVFAMLILKTFVRVWLCIFKGTISSSASLLVMVVGVYLELIWI